jgi:hypothetical protein
MPVDLLACSYRLCHVSDSGLFVNNRNFGRRSPTILLMLSVCPDRVRVGGCVIMEMCYGNGAEECRVNLVGPQPDTCLENFINNEVDG